MGYKEKRVLPAKIKFLAFGFNNSVIGIIISLVILTGSFGMITNFVDFDEYTHLNSEFSIEKGIYKGTSKKMNFFLFKVYTCNYYVEAGSSGMYGTSYGSSVSYAVGDTIDIEIANSDPSYHRIKGMRHSYFGVFTILVFLVLLIPLYGIVYMFRQIKKRIYLFEYGKITEGKVLSVEEHRDNEGNVTHDVEFSYIAKDGYEYTAKQNTDSPNRLDFKEKHYILYDEDDPARMESVDLLLPVLYKYIIRNKKKFGIE